MQVPYFRPDINDDDVTAVSAVLRSGWLTTGPIAHEFEREFRSLLGAQHAVAVNSCTNGLHAALVAHGIGPGDEVLTTPLTFCGTIRAIEETGATPVFVDIGADLNVDTRLLADAVTPRTGALLPVHLGGLPCDLGAIEYVARKHNLPVIEDAAHAFGAKWKGQPIGSSEFSTAVFSFYANKNLTSGEGGMITTADAELGRCLRRTVNYGMQRDSDEAESRWRYEVVERGFKYNMSDILAALGRSQLRKAEEAARARAAVAEFYDGALSGLEEVELPSTDERTSHAWHLYAIRLRLEQLETGRDDFIVRMAERGVACSVHFRPIPLHSWFAHYGPIDRWPKTAREFPRLVSLPIYPSLSEAECEFVAKQVRAVLEASRKRSFALA